MPSVLECPSCGRRLRAPAELGAGEVRCPACGGVFEAAAALARALRPGETPPDEEVLRDDGSALPLIPGVPPPPAPFKPVLVESAQDPPRPAPSSRGLVRCPRCRRNYAWELARCPFCDTGDSDAPPWEKPFGPMRRDSEPHRGPLLKALGMTSLLLGLPALCGALCPPFAVAGLLSAPLGIVTWALASGDLEKMKRREMDVEGRPATELGKSYAQAGTFLGLIGVLLGVLMYGLLVFGPNGW